MMRQHAQNHYKCNNLVSSVVMQEYGCWGRVVAETYLHDVNLPLAVGKSVQEAKSELDLFSVPPTQTTTEHESCVEYHLVTTVTDGSPIEFDVSSLGDDYVDFANTMLHVKAKVTHGNDTDLAADSVVSSVNLFLHSLFSQVDISLNGTLITSSTNTYPYRAMIETLLSYGMDAKNPS